MENWKDSIEPVEGPRFRVKNWMNAHTFVTKGERFVLPSLTVPDMSLSITELLQRQSAGLPLIGKRIPVFDPEDDLPDLRTLDLAEIAELKQRYAAEYSEIKSSVDAEIQAKKAESQALLRKQMEEVWKQEWDKQNAIPKSTNNP
jgi:hypothetical protein